MSVVHRDHRIDLHCTYRSPLNGTRCELEPGHAGAHRCGTLPSPSSIPATAGGTRDEASSLRSSANCSTVGDLLDMLRGYSPTALLLCQVVAENGQAWMMLLRGAHGDQCGFKWVQNPLILTMSHPELKQLPQPEGQGQIPSPVPQPAAASSGEREAGAGEPRPLSAPAGQRSSVTMPLSRHRTDCGLRGPKGVYTNHCTCETDNPTDAEIEQAIWDCITAGEDHGRAITGPTVTGKEAAEAFHAIKKAEAKLLGLIRSSRRQRPSVDHAARADRLTGGAR